MSSVYPSNPDQGITLRQAALVAGIGLLNAPDFLTVFGSDQLHAQVKLLLS